MIETIRDNFTESIQTKIAAIEILPEALEQATYMMVQTLIAGQKILCCGSGGSAMDAQQFASLLLNRFEGDRPSLPALALSCDAATITCAADEASYDEIFSKQIRALGQSNDILLAISADGNSRNIIMAMEAALNRDMTIIALTGKDGGEMAGLLGPNDLEVRVPSNKSQRIHEVHQLVIHTLCNGIDNCLFPEHNGDE
ncbi:D-sedoheptulose-7-phosphate isomerase [Lacimicrobium alkaliphilum]|uniref:Phosphoheptose isomerase n=1 Tax=Lacimicrobium alkaliphilum TaxID=1526571 RepID=A0ABQ1QZF5_9ALTE|nr:SIS domain-containing protein [Lacimicrobium alkaliphilum]GGD51086.1 phosphoheptose isomerase [Lacimicrobium alkaliphilum]